MADSMCIIVDACAVGDFFTDSPTEAALAVRDWIETKGGKLVYGGKLTIELSKSNRARAELRSLWQRGRALQYRSSVVDKEATRLSSTNACTSNDQHVIALARISGARVLYSYDANSGLHADFKNPDLVDNPRGGVYKHIDHKHLLAHHASCHLGAGTANIASPTYAKDGRWEQ